MGSSVLRARPSWCLPTIAALPFVWPHYPSFPTFTFLRTTRSAAAKQLGDGVRVVSLPCFERFDRQPSEYREEVLPDECRKRVAIEAGVTEIWYQYVGLDGKVIGLHQFGLSAPGAEVMKERGIDAQHVIDAAESL